MSGGKKCLICIVNEPSIGRSARLFVAGMRYERTVEGDETIPHLCATHRRQVQDADLDAEVERARQLAKGNA